MPKKQAELAGMERPVIKEIEEAAESYRAVRDKRMALTEKEIAAKVNLIQVVSEHHRDLTRNEKGELCYRYDDMIVVLKPGSPNVKVRAAHDEEPEDED